jgi:hypothetical protein
LAFPRLTTKGFPSARAALAGLSFLAAAGCESSIHQVTVRSTEPPPPLLVSRFEPEPGEVEVGPASTFHVVFADPLDPASLPEEPLSFTDAQSGMPFPGAVSLEDGDTVLVFEPDGTPSGAEYCLTLSSDLKSLEGGSIRVVADSSGCAATYTTFSSAPSLSGTIRAEARSSSSLEVIWDEVEVSEEGCSFNVFVAPSGEAIDPSFPAQTAPPGSISAVVTGLAPNTVYQAAIQARDPAGNASALSQPAAARTLPDTLDQEPPAFAGIASLTALSPTSALAAWAPAADGVDPPELLRYNAYVALAAGGQDFEVFAATSAPGATELVVGGLSPDTTHFVVVRAVDTSDNEDENAVEASATTPVSYSLNVRPILTRSDQGGCTRIGCHIAPNPDGELSLDTYEGLIRGGTHKDPGAVVPGDGKGSYLLWRTDQSNPNYQRLLPRMPQGGRALPEASLRQLERWIDQGALDN